MRVCVTNDYGDSVERVRICRVCRSYYVTNEKEIGKRGSLATKYVQSSFAQS